MISKKNLPLSPAGVDLGLGQQLQQEMEDAELARRKKLMQNANAVAGGMGSATQSLFGASGGFSV